MIKGIQRSYAQKHIRHSLYKKALFDSVTNHTVQFLEFRSKRHDVYTVNSSKRALSAFDDKKYLLLDGVSSLPYFHYKLACK